MRSCQKTKALQNWLLVSNFTLNPQGCSYRFNLSGEGQNFILSVPTKINRSEKFILALIWNLTQRFLRSLRSRRIKAAPKEAKKALNVAQLEKASLVRSFHRAASDLGGRRILPV